MTEVKPLSDEERLFTGVHGPHPQAVNDIRRAFTALKAENEKLRGVLEKATGYLLNAKIDLETEAPRRTAIRTIEGGLTVVRAALAKG